MWRWYLIKIGRPKLILTSEAWKHKIRKSYITHCWLRANVLLGQNVNIFKRVTNLYDTYAKKGQNRNEHSKRNQEESIFTKCRLSSAIPSLSNAYFSFSYKEKKKNVLLGLSLKFQRRQWCIFDCVSSNFHILWNCDINHVRCYPPRY